MPTKSDPLPRCVLIARFSALGDVAISIPVIYSMCSANPHTRFVMITRPFMAQAFVECPPNLMVLGIDLKKDYKGLTGMWRLAGKLRHDYGIDAVADLHSVMRTWVIDLSMWLHGAKVKRINKGHGEKRALVGGKIRHQLSTSHERYTAVFNKLGFHCQDTFAGYTQLKHTTVVPPKEAGYRWIAIAPFSQHRGKEYPLSLIEQVIAPLSKMPRVKIFLMGGGDKEKQALLKLALAHENTISLASIDHDFGDEFAIMSQCEVMVSMDSANMHLASLVGLPVVSVWGATHPYCGFMGWHQSPDNAIALDLPCRPCSVFGQKPCRHGDYHCLTGIKPETIVAKVKEFLHD